MKTLIKLLAATAFVTLAASGTALAYTKADCIADKGEWKQIFGNRGTCTFTVEIRGDGEKPIDLISAKKCKELGGQVSDDGKTCTVNTKNIMPGAEKKQTN